MDQTSGQAKVCVACGADCAHQRRVRDARGRYLCGACYDERLARREASASEAEAAPGFDPIGLGAGALDEIGYDIEPVSAGIASMASCPGCGGPLAAGAVVCVGCGFNTHTGHKTTAKVLRSTEDEAMRAAQRARRARNAEATVAAYRTPTIMFVVGMVGVMGVVGLIGGPLGMMAYGVSFAVDLVIGLMVYWMCSVLWIGFNESLSLSFVLLAGIYSISNLAQVVLGFVPIPIVPWVISFGIYVHLLTEMLDIDLADAIILAFITFVFKWIAVFTLIAALMNALGLGSTP